jgi:DNA-binding MarR family transcriptional regulator
VTRTAATLPDVFRLVEQLNRKLERVQRLTVRDTGLTPPQYVALSQLWEQDGQPLKDLAAGNHCTPATMTTIVDGLERKGFVTREPHPDDRRSLQVRLTAEGRRMRGAAPNVEDMFRGCCSGLSPDDTRTLANLLTRLDTALAGWDPEIQR